MRTRNCNKVTQSFKDVKNLIKSKKARDEQGLFVTEGIKIFSETPMDRVEAVFATAEFAGEHPEMISRIPAGTECVLDVRADRFAGISDTKSPPGIIAVVRKKKYTLSDILGLPGQQSEVPGGSNREECEIGRVAGCRAAPLVIVLENLQDPGNAGTILRTAEAAGVSGVILTEGSVDLYNPKVIRSTMGCIFRMPHLVVKSADELLPELRAAGITTYAAHLRGSISHFEGDYTGGTAFFIGNESRGLSDELSGKLDVLMKIPMSGKVESLNAAMAAGILMYEAKRQRIAAGYELLG
jgi:TrmH family RNA methyltransferase